MFTFFGVVFIIILLFLIGYVGCLWSMWKFYPGVFKQLVLEIKNKDIENYDKLLKDGE
jgi:hypothetical protein